MDNFHRDIDIVVDHMPENEAERDYFKQIMLHIDFDDIYDIMNVTRALAQCIKVMANILLRNLKLDNGSK